MPDLLTHTAVVGLLARGARRRADLVLLLVGTLLPDVVGRPLMLVPGMPMFHDVPSHALAMQPLYAWAAGAFLAPAVRVRGRRLMLAGALVHLLLDGLQSHVGAWFTYYFFFPVSWHHTSAGFVHPSCTVVAAPVLAAAALLAWCPPAGLRVPASGILRRTATGRAHGH